MRSGVPLSPSACLLRFGPLPLHSRRGLSVLRRPAHGLLCSGVAFNTLSSRAVCTAFLSVATPNQSFERTASQPLNSNVRAHVVNALRRSTSLPRRVFAHGVVRHPLRPTTRTGEKRCAPSYHPSAPATAPNRAATRRNAALTAQLRHHRKDKNAFFPSKHRGVLHQPNLKLEYQVQCKPRPGALMSLVTARLLHLVHWVRASFTGTLTHPSSGRAFGPPLK